MTMDEIKKQYEQNRKQIIKLYNTYTPLKEIRKLAFQNEVAYKNELKKLGQA